MSANDVPTCERLALADLIDYSTGEMAGPDAEALEAHLFSCPQCASRAEGLDALVRSIHDATRSAQVSGFVTDDVLNRLARDGVRVRTFALSPGAVVPCAVWEDDDVMAVRLRGDFDATSEVTLSRRVAGREGLRVTGHVGPAAREIIYAEPAALIREFPSVEVELQVTARDGDRERTIGTYTLLHGGSLRR